MNFIAGPSRLINDEIVRREIQGEPKWMQRRLREVTYHQQMDGLVPSKPDKTTYSTKKAQVGFRRAQTYVIGDDFVVVQCPSLNHAFSYASSHLSL